MADVWLGRFNRALEKLFNVKGGPTVVDVNHQVQAMIGLDRGVDQRYLEGWNRFASVAAVAALAANFARARIRNPPGSNVILVLEQLNVMETAPDTPLVTWGATITDLANLVSITFSRMDPRGNPQPTAIVSQNSQAAGGLVFMQRAVGSTLNADFINYSDQQIPVLPGQVVDVGAQVANQAMQVGFMWRERALESSELT